MLFFLNAGCSCRGYFCITMSISHLLHHLPSLLPPRVCGLQRAYIFVSSRDSLHFSRICASRGLSQQVSVEKKVNDLEDEAPSHVPVLLKEVLSIFEGSNLRTFVDCTLGAGGHASALINEHPELQKFVGLDVDPIAHSEASPKLQAAVKHSRSLDGSCEDLSLHLFCANFRNVKCLLEKVDPKLVDGGVDGILMDLGMSSMQLNVSQRGFSLQLDGPADMRMDPLLSLKAEDILNSWPEREVGRIIREYGEESQWQRLARKISEARLAGGIHTTSQLLEIIQNSTSLKFSGRQGWKKTAIRVFQALRIAVNDELTSLEVALSDAYACLAPKGRFAVISFHSLEDRIVKQFFLKAIGDEGNTELSELHTHIPGQTRYSEYQSKKSHEGEKRKNIVEGKYSIILTKRPVTAGMDEVTLNRRSRSAKLRVIEKR